jgi:hypothetical protein
MLQRNGHQLEIAAISQPEEISSNLFSPDRSARRRFSPASDVITFCGLIHPAFTANPPKFISKRSKIKAQPHGLLRE